MDDQIADQVPRQLPADATCFTDHEPYIARLDRMARVEPGEKPPRGVPIALVTGHGGMGKTALAIHWAHRVSAQFPDGQFYCDLRGSSDESPVEYAAVAESLLQVLGVRPGYIPVDPGQRVALLRSKLATRKALFVLDNAASSAQVIPLIGGGPGSMMIVTSRNPLSDLRVRHGAQHIRLDIFRPDHAVALLGRLMMDGDRQEKDEELAELARLCANLPLALRIVASNAVSQPDLALAEILAELRDATTRWETLSTEEGEAIKAIFEWSYRRLDDDAQRTFRLLGLHAGQEVSLGAAAAAAGLPGREARRILYTLTQNHLLEPPAGGTGRYRQHDLLQKYAVDLEAAVDGEADRRETVGRIVRWYTVAARDATRILLPGRECELSPSPLDDLLEPPRFDSDGSEDSEDEAYEWYETERQNMVVCARSALAADLPHRTWELALALAPLHSSYFAFDDWSELSELAVTAAGQMREPSALPAALDNRGRYLLRRGRLPEAEEEHRRALALREKARDAIGICQSLNALGLVRLQAGDPSRAIERFEDVMARSQRSGQSWWHGAASLNLAAALMEPGERTAPDPAALARASEVLRPLPEFFRGCRDALNVGTSYHLIARACRLRSDLPGATAAIGKALRIAVDEKKPVWEADWQTEAAYVHLDDGDVAEAERHSRRAVDLQRQVGDWGREAAALECLSAVLEQAGRGEDASHARDQAAELRESQRRDRA